LKKRLKIQSLESGGEFKFFKFARRRLLSAMRARPSAVFGPVDKPP
jgi:hypothetical protein